MSIKSTTAKIFAKYIVHKTSLWANNPIATQRKVFENLIQKAQNTQFGIDHHFASIHTHEDFVNRVQNMRKDMGLEVLDKIGIEVQKNGELATAALTEFNNYIRTETQALSLELKENVVDGTEVDMDEFVLKVKISRAGKP